MTDSPDEDTAVRTETRFELDRLRARIDLQSQHLSRHARELSQLHRDLESLDERIDAHHHRYAPSYLVNPHDGTRRAG